jgi:hypothetical protein
MVHSSKKRLTKTFQTYKSRGLLNSRFSKVNLAIFALIFAGLGAYVIFHSFASGFFASTEPENGTLSSAVSSVNDTNASKGKAVQFGGSNPAACNNGGTFLWGNLETCGWPGPANTGYDISQCPGGVLAVNSGSNTRIIHVSTANSTVSCQNITGCLSIDAANITVSNVKVSCTSGKTGTNANGSSVINVSDGASATINHTEINGMNGVHACIWHQGTSLSVDAVNCYGINDGIFSWADTSFSQTTGDNFTIQNSYLHDFTGATANGHIDGYQTEGAANGMINHNTFLMTSDIGNDSDSAVAIWDSLKSSHDITVQNNLITGGGFAIYAEDYSPSEASPAGGFSVTNIFYTNNKFSTHLFSCIGSFGVWYPRGVPTDAWHRSGNKVLETGFNLDNGNPAGCN